MERALASIQTIKALNPIPDADAIEVADILGWKVVVKKGEFAVGDWCVYCEVDSVLPEKPEFEFLRSKKFRIKTVRLRRVLSQGIAFPFTMLPTGNYAEGDDVTEAMGIVKWEPVIPACMGGDVKGSFPSYAHKTDEMRIQSYPALIDEMKGLEIYVATKCDGTSATFIHRDGEFDVCSRNLSLKEGGNVYWQMFRKYNLEKALKQAGNFAIQGEICGPGIQKNPLGLKEPELFVFNVFDIDTQKFLSYPNFRHFCESFLLQTVPIEEECVTFDFTLEQLLARSKGKYPSGKRKEGIVIRPVEEHYSQVLCSRMSFKVINDDFLEKDEE